LNLLEQEFSVVEILDNQASKISFLVHATGVARLDWWAVTVLWCSWLRRLRRVRAGWVFVSVEG
jgi:hypothetical protein